MYEKWKERQLLIRKMRKVTISIHFWKRLISQDVQSRCTLILMYLSQNAN